MTTAPAPTIERLATPAQQVRPGLLVPASWNAESRTIDVTWTTGARGARFNSTVFEVVDEELATDASAVRLDRLNSGAPVLDAHRQGALANQIGVVVPGSARMANGVGVATVQLSARDDLAGIVADIAAGIIRNISVGYAVHEYAIEQRDGQRPLYRAVDWEPFEISFVPVPFDAGAQVRTRAAGQHEESNMTTESDPAPKDRGNHKPMGASAALMLIDVARARGASVEARARELIDQNERGAISAEAAREALMIALADHQRAQTSGISNMRLGGDATFDNPEFLARSIEDGLYARMSGQAPSEPGRQFANLSIVDVCRELLVAQGDHDARRMAPAQVLQRATRGGGGGYFERKGGMHSTSDFPQLLGNATGRFLIDQFGEMESPLKAIARMRSASDFKTISGVQLSGIGKLDKIVEGGEIKRGTLSERAESFKVETFSKIFSLSREAMINDDLGSFSDTVRIMARAGAETEAAILAGLLNSNPLLADGKAVFHADHGNLAASGALPDVTTLSAARLAMRNQVDLDGSTPYPTDPRYLVVSSKNETVGEQLLSTIAANSVSAVNPFSQRLELLVDPRLSANPWYVFGAPNVSPGLEYAYLNGATGPQIEMSPGWNTLGEEYRCTLDFGAGWTEHRAAYRNPGA